MSIVKVKKKAGSHKTVVFEGSNYDITKDGVLKSMDTKDGELLGRFERVKVPHLQGDKVFYQNFSRTITEVSGGSWLRLEGVEDQIRTNQVKDKKINLFEPLKKEDSWDLLKEAYAILVRKGSFKFWSRLLDGSISKAFKLIEQFINQIKE